MSQSFRTIGILFAALVLVDPSGGIRVENPVEKSEEPTNPDASANSYHEGVLYEVQSKEDINGPKRISEIVWTPILSFGTKSVFRKALDSRKDFVEFIILLAFLYFYYSLAVALISLQKGSLNGEMNIPDLFDPKWKPFFRKYSKKVNSSGKKFTKVLRSLVRSNAESAIAMVAPPFFLVSSSLPRLPAGFRGKCARVLRSIETILPNSITGRVSELLEILEAPQKDYIRESSNVLKQVLIALSESMQLLDRENSEIIQSIGEGLDTILKAASGFMSDRGRDLAIVGEKINGIFANYLNAVKEVVYRIPGFVEGASQTATKYIDSVSKTPMELADIIQSLDKKLLRENANAWRFALLIAEKAEELTNRLGLVCIENPPSLVCENARDLLALFIKFALISAATEHNLNVVKEGKSTKSLDDSMQFRIAFSYSLLLKPDLERLSQLDGGTFSKVSNHLSLLSLEGLEGQTTDNNSIMKEWISGAFPIIRQIIAVAKTAPKQSLELIKESFARAMSHSRTDVDYLKLGLPDLLLLSN